MDRPLVYWDACILIALLTDEDRPDGEMEGVYSWAERIDREEAVLVVSSLNRLEVLPTHLSSAQEEVFQNFLKRSNVMEVEMGARVIEKARELMDFYQQLKPESGKILCRDDAIHLATAILYEVEEFHTFDEVGKGRCLGLIPLSGNVAGHPLKILKPAVEQYTFDLDRPAE